MIPDVISLHFESVGARVEDSDCFVSFFEGFDEYVLALNVSPETVECGRWFVGGFGHWNGRGGSSVKLLIVMVVDIAIAIAIAIAIVIVASLYFQRMQRMQRR